LLAAEFQGLHGRCVSLAILYAALIFGVHQQSRSFTRFGCKFSASAGRPAAMENDMKMRTRLRSTPRQRPELVFAGFAAFILLLVMLIRAIDMLAVR
jgi:hypothetical protein